MRIALLISGTRGNIQPAVALGVGLEKAGHEVLLATFEEFPYSAKTIQAFLIAIWAKTKLKSSAHW